MKLGIVIPALNEAETIGPVVEGCRRAGGPGDLVRVVVCDNGSSDATPQLALRSGAEVLRVERRGYGAACRGGVDHLAEWPDVLVFVDADGSSRPEEMSQLLDPIRRGRADLVLGRRRAGSSLTPVQKWGTSLAVSLIFWRWGHRFEDMGPFRAIRRGSLELLGLRDETWGWTLEMQILAVLKQLRISELPVSWGSRRGGRSKISGSLVGTIRAGCRILQTFAFYALYSSRFALQIRDGAPAPRGG